MKLKLLLISAVAAAAIAPAAQAAPVLLTDGYVFAGADQTAFTTPYGPTAPTTTYYELVNASGATMQGKVTLSDTDPNARTVSYTVYVDNNNAVGAGDTGGTVASSSLTDIGFDSNVPFLQFVMQAGVQYVLALTRTDAGISQVTTTVSAVPLPGAIWLFGSALLGFLGFSNRRKI